MEKFGSVRDQRQVERRILDAPWFADAHFGGRTCSITILEFSTAGAKLLVGHDDVPGVLPEGSRCGLDVHLPSGNIVTVAVSLGWSSIQPEGLLIGVRFIDTPDELFLQEMIECSTPAAVNELSC